MRAAPLREREFAHIVHLAAADPAWEVDAIAATAPVTDSPYRGYVRHGTEPDARYAYMAGRTTWTQEGVPVCEGLLYEVSGDLRRDPAGLPSNGRAFREVSEAIVAADPRVLPSLRAAYGR
ncbi:MAG TPA: hypothetical protein VFY91_03375 [Microbacterium sp.]|nr:hypothetical protein [Microbacterium sp.]